MNNSKFDLNTVIGFLLIGGILFYFGYVNQVQPPEAAEGAVAADSVQTEQVETTVDTASSTVATDDSVDVGGKKIGPFAQIEEEEFFTLENDLLKLRFSSMGAQIVSAELKDYSTWDSLPLHLINENSVFNINLEGGQTFNTSRINFKGEQTGNSVRFTLNGDGGKALTYLYTIEDGSYMVDWDITSRGMQGMLDQNSGLTWEMQTLRHEKNVKNEKNSTTLNYRLADDSDVDDLSAGSNDEEEEENIKWVAYKQQFFSSILINRQGEFEKAGMVSRVVDAEDITKVFASKLSLQTVSGELNAPLGLYLGPNKYEILKDYDQKFEKLIPLGWGIFGWINRGVVITLFNFLEDYGINYGIIILIMAVLIKLVLFPLTYTSYKSMAKMRVLKPEIDELNERFKDKDPMKKQQATLELYQKAGVNPLGGCIPVLLQMPILIALFRFFPSSIELRQQSFLWADDLSTYDSIWTFGEIPIINSIYGDHVSLFTLLMTVSTLIYTYMNQQLSGQNQQYPQLKYIVYLMPIVFLGVFNNYAAGLSYYYFVANVITFSQQYAIRAYIDEDKILKRIEEKKQQPTKENRLMRRMKEMQEQQNRQARRKK